MVTKLNKKIKFASKSSMAFRELKKAGHLVKGVMAENRRLKKENDVLIKTITALQESSKPVEDLQHLSHVDGEERIVLLLDLQAEEEEPQLSFPEEEATHSHFSNNAYEDLIYNNNKTEKSVFDDDYQSICDALLALRDAEELVNNQRRGGGTEIVAAAAAMLSFCS